MNKYFKYAFRAIKISIFAGLILISSSCDKQSSHEEIEVLNILVGGSYPTNCYLVWTSETNEAMVIDPGFEHKKIFKIIEQKGLDLKYIVHTHGHFDHTNDSSPLQKLTGATVYIHPKQKRYSRVTPKLKIEDKYIKEIEDGDTISLGYASFKVIHTPGHSPGSICLYNSGVLFSGDLLFKGAVGRTDFAGGNHNELIKSLTKRLAFIPDETKVYPGHGEATDLAHERKTNRFILGTK